jgi:pimeloyl-ACP methyl ester carboxylesterase
MSHFLSLKDVVPGAAALLVLTSATASAQSHSDVTFSASVRGVSTTLHADVYTNSRPDHGQLTILAVHGLTETGSMWAPLATAIFADSNLTNRVARVIAIDLPGHGQSVPPTLPSPLKFGDLLIEDNASIVIQAIDALGAQGLAPTWIMGHSMGGLAVQLAQEQLLSVGSSLAQHGVSRATLVAAVPARGTVWTQGGGDSSAFIVTDPVLGTILNVPTAYCGVTGGFTTLSNTLVPGAPDLATCLANGWSGIEPINAVVELVGAYCVGNPDSPSSVGLCRPYVRPMAFAPTNGTRLTVIGFSQDILTPIVDQDDLYTYLTGVSANSEDPPYLFRPVVSATAVHSTFVADPAAVVSAIRNGTP